MLQILLWDRNRSIDFIALTKLAESMIHIDPLYCSVSFAGLLERLSVEQLFSSSLASGSVYMHPAQRMSSSFPVSPLADGLSDYMHAYYDSPHLCSWVDMSHLVASLSPPHRPVTSEVVLACCSI